MLSHSGGSMKHITNASHNSYKELWQSIFGSTYRDKFTFNHDGYNFSGGGGHYPTYDLTLATDVYLLPEYPFQISNVFEQFDVPEDVMLFVCNKSTLARLGVDASCNTFIDNGFKGNLTIEIYLKNKSKGVDLPKGLPIVQVIAMPLMYPCDGYKGKYQNQENKPVGAK